MYCSRILHKGYRVLIAFLVSIVNYSYPVLSSTIIAIGPYQLKIAATPQNRIQGLQGVRHIPKNTGMLFVYPDPTKAVYWMYGCYTAMDIIFLDVTGKVQSIIPAMPPNARGLLPEQYTRYTANGPMSANQAKYATLPKTAYVVEVALGEGINFAKTNTRLIPKAIAKAGINAI